MNYKTKYIIKKEFLNLIHGNGVHSDLCIPLPLHKTISVNFKMFSDLSQNSPNLQDFDVI